MRKVLLIFVLLVVAGVLGWLIWRSLDSLAEKKEREVSISKIPELAITLLDGKAVLLTEISENSQVIVILFNSECDHCQYEAKSIATHLDKFPENTRLVFLTEEPLSSISSFEKMYFGTSPSNVTFAQADLLQLIDTFKKISYPTIFVYDGNGILIKEFKGETKVESILALID